MNTKRYHSISASEDEEISSSENEVENCKVIEVVEEKSPGGLVKSKTFKEILSKVKGVKYDFSDVRSSNSILYSNEITEDDEIWLMQTPRDVNLELIEETNFKIEDSSRTTLKVRKREKHYNVHVIQSKKEVINSSLPMEKTQSFHMTLFPISGRIILQEDFQANDKNENPSKTLTKSSDSCINLADSQILDTDNIAPSIKKKRKSIKQDTV